jgi:branched-subunit amino acid aminotransferase/4-amino-4-deoxychorismate lyase
MDNHIFFNNKIVPLKKVFISINDRGFLYGDGFFETFRTINGKFLDFRFHFSRMVKASRFFKIDFKLTMNDILNILKELKRLNNLKNVDCYSRITVTRGVDPYGPSIKQEYSPTVVIEVKRLPQYVADRSEKGVKTTILENFKKERNVLYNYKTINYLPSIIGFLNRKNFDDVIFLDKFNCLIEGITANLFFYKGKTLYTSNEDSLFLKGVTREVILKGIKKFPEYKFNIRYRNFKFQELDKIDGAFLTNSLSGIYPVLSIEDKQLRHRKEIIATLKEIYMRFLETA